MKILHRKTFLPISFRLLKHVADDLTFDIFIKRTEKDFHMIFPKKQKVDWGRLSKYEAKVDSLYIHRSDRFAYKKVLKTLLAKFENELAIVDKFKENISLIIETLGNEMILSHDIDPILLDFAQTASKENIQIFIEDNKIKLPHLIQCIREAPSGHKHGLLTSIFSLIIAKNIRIDSKDAALRLSLASFLHDLGEMSDVKGLSPDEIKAQHPKRSSQLMSQFGVLDLKLLKIVEQHHEREDGSGFPRGLSYSSIEGETKIVSVADRMAEIFEANLDKEDWTMVDTLNEFLKEKHFFNEFIVQALTKLFEDSKLPD